MFFALSAGLYYWIREYLFGVVYSKFDINFLFSVGIFYGLGTI